MKLFSRSGRGVALGVAGVCSALVLSGCGGGGAGDGGSDKLELDMASFVAPDTGQGQAYEAWMNEVEEASRAVGSRSPPSGTASSLVRRRSRKA